MIRFKEAHRPDNVAWDGLILWLAFPECWRATPLWADPSMAIYTLELPAGTRTDPPETNNHARKAVKLLFDLLDAFWEEREQFRGLAKIFVEYASWLESEPATSSSPEHVARHIQARLTEDEASSTT